MSGTLYLCGTPIGNLEDATYRLIHTLETVDLIAAEDTRNTLKLLNHFQIKTPLVSYYEHNKAAKGPLLAEKLKEGMNIALVSDAGMPGISDPGADLLLLCITENIPVTTVPGPTAMVSGLVLSGMDTRRFVFEGFLPREKKERKAVLETLEKEHRTMIFYEAPHRLQETLEILGKTLGMDRKISTARELTKKFEEVKRGTIASLLAEYEKDAPKGEFVLIAEGYSLQQQKLAAAEDWEKIPLAEHMNRYLEAGMRQKDAMKQVAKDRNVAKREIYRLLHVSE